MDSPTFPEDERVAREALIEAARWMNSSGFNSGTSGNLSVRQARAGAPGLLITPSGVPYESLQAGDIVWMDMQGRYEHTLSASSEWAFHLDILRHKPEVNAVVHAHPSYCTALAIHGRAIPAVHYMVAFSGGADIPCARYETYGTPELSAAVLEALAQRNACLMAHHGMVATGPTLARALWWAAEVETLARQYHLALQLGTPPLLPSAEIERVREKFKSYGLKEKGRR